MITILDGPLYLEDGYYTVFTATINDIGHITNTAALSIHITDDKNIKNFTTELGVPLGTFVTGVTGMAAPDAN